MTPEKEKNNDIYVWIIIAACAGYFAIRILITALL